MRSLMDGDNQTHLNASPAGGNVYFNCGGEVTTSEFLFLSLLSLDHWNGQQICVNLTIKI